MAQSSRLPTGTSSTSPAHAASSGHDVNPRSGSHDTLLARDFTVSDSAESDQESPDGQADHRSLAPPLRRVLFIVLTFSLLLFPFFFGGVHAPSYIAERVLVCGGLLFFWFKNRPRILDTFRRGSSARTILFCFFAIGAFVLVQSTAIALVSPFFADPHPVLGERGGLASVASLREGLLAGIGFTALFVLARAWLGSLSFKAGLLSRLLLLAGLLVSLTALSHWFYDNGKLFWTFAPESEFVSDRARWPFVNSNHLGDFLLPIFFLSLGLLQAKIFDLYNAVLTTHRSNKRTWGLLLQSRRVQRHLLALAMVGLVPLASSLAIISSLSRGAWLGTSVGLFLMLLLSRLHRSPRNSAPPLPNPLRASPDAASMSDSEGSSSHPLEPTHRRRSRSRANRASSLTSDHFQYILDRGGRFASVSFLLLGAALLYFFLFGRGAELFADRLQHGLLYSLEDIRWQLYRETLSMFADHWILGVGFGAWAAYHPAYMQPALSGINPVYLHSDPLQLAVELGAIGSMIVLASVIVLAATARSALRRLREASEAPRSSKDSRQDGSRPLSALSTAALAHQCEALGSKAVLISLCAGLAALTVASLVDFPFRIPAIASLTAAILALFSFYCDKQHPTHRPTPPASEPFEVVE